MNARIRSTFGFGLLFGLAGALLAVVSARPAAAEWLVTSEGARVETRGPWQLKGKLVVFTSADGTLYSLRQNQVDLAASKRANEERQKMVVEDISHPAEKRKAVRSITDKDFTHSGAAAVDAKPADAKDGKEAKDAKDGKGDVPAAKPKDYNPLTIGTWQKVDRPEKDGIELFGELKNEGPNISAQVGLTVSLVDEAGTVMATTEAILTSNAIEPRSSTNFRAIFPGVFTFAKAKFEARSDQLRMQAIDAPKDKSKS